ncbi:MAG: serine/threonine protein kinase [Myxococcales bacterium]|nr:serine/threonine protein kinase [Myxococcales bacterium]
MTTQHSRRGGQRDAVGLRETLPSGPRLVLDRGPSGDARSLGLSETRLMQEEQRDMSWSSGPGDARALGLERTRAPSERASGRAADRSAPGGDARALVLAATQTPDPSAPRSGGDPTPYSRDRAARVGQTDRASRLGALASPPDADDALMKGMVLSGLFSSVARAKIGRYTILALLGEGGMGSVYSAYDEQLDRKIAVKVLRPEALQSETGRVRLLREAQAMARLSHNNIVTVHEAGEHAGRVYVAMEFVRGQSLDRWIAPTRASADPPRPRPWRAVVEVFSQAARGLAAAHREGIVHRDFKPHNAMLGDDGVVKVLDFGLARGLEHAAADELIGTSEGEERPLLEQHLTRTGAIMGTPAYMAPEQHLGRVADARSDQFSFCVALYEGLYGEHPFPTTSLVAIIEAVTSGRVRAAPAGAQVPAWLRRHVLRGLSEDPAKRFASMDELLRALASDPARRRRRWLTGALVVLSASGASFGLARSTGAQAPAPCEGVADDFAGVWSGRGAAAEAGCARRARAGGRRLGPRRAPRRRLRARVARRPPAGV